MAIDEPSILQQVIKENRKLIQEQLKDVIEAAEYIFEHGHLTRGECREIEDSEAGIQRSNRFLEILMTK